MRRHRPLSPTLEIFDDGANRVRPRVIGIYAVLITANLLAWAGAFASFHGYPLLLATALIGYGLGLRHAVYADHIAAIDNVTRKMMQEGKRPITAAFFFPRPLDRRDRGVDPDSGRGEHPSAALSRPDRDRGVVGTLISVLFLFAIPIINIVVLAGVYRLLRRVRR